MNSFLQITAIVLACSSALLSILVMIPLRKAMATPAFWAVKVLPSALAPFLALAGALSVVIGLTAGPVWAAVPGFIATVIFLQYLYRIHNSMKTSPGFIKAYGPEWESGISADQKTHFLTKPLAFRLPVIPDSDFNLKQNIPFCTLPGTGRQLLCDLWQPAKNVKPSGLAFIYFHGSAWVVWDKDIATRPLFRHLVAQGHVIMDVAYRLYPETNMTGMVHDIYRAVAWMKTNASSFGVNSDSIVIGGGSAGGHLSLLAAYTNDPLFVPEELQRKDLTVHAVISLYGPPDLQAAFYHSGQPVTSREVEKKPKKAKPMPPWVQKMMGVNYQRMGMDKMDIMGKDGGVLPQMFGCFPDECPEVYDRFSPITHVHPGCPQTLLIQGEHDLITPVESVQATYRRLTEAGVSAVLYLLPQTDHAFDLALPRISPVAHTAFYMVERFLALQVRGLDGMIPGRETVTEAENKRTDLYAAEK
jgi:acetyl esterase/lipase